MPSNPYEPKPSGGYTVPAGQSGYWPIQIPHRCFICKIVVQQMHGPGVDFTVEFFNSENAVQGLSESDSIGNEEGKLPPAVYSVTGPLVGHGGSFNYFNENGGGFQFFSQDYRSRNGLGMPQIWMKITPHGGVGNIEFALGLGVLGME